MDSDQLATLDADTLTELAEIGDKEFVEELFDGYMADAAERMENLGKAIAEANADNIKALAHSLKGASNSVGAKGLGEMCLAMEGLAGSDADEADALVEKMRTEFKRLEGEVAVFLCGME